MPTIRRARPEELDSIWTLVRAAIALMNAQGSFQWSDDYPTREDFAQPLSRGELYAACGEDGELLGVAVFNTFEDPCYEELDGWTARPPALVIHKMAVDPAAQGKGTAAALFAYAIELTRTMGLRSLRGDTYILNQKMQHLFQKFGFRRVGEVHFPDRPLEFPVYEKVLFPE